MGGIFDFFEFPASATDIDPFVKDQSDNKIMYTANDDQYWDSVEFTDINNHRLVDEYNTFYTHIKNNVTMKQRDRVKNDLVGIIKRNSSKNVSNLNKLVISLIKIDPEYKNKLCLETV